jgi:hypothetical protein
VFSRDFFRAYRLSPIDGWKRSILSLFLTTNGNNGTGKRLIRPPQQIQIAGYGAMAPLRALPRPSQFVGANPCTSGAIPPMMEQIFVQKRPPTRQKKTSGQGLRQKRFTRPSSFQTH